MNYLRLLALALCVLSVCGQAVPGWTMVWNDEFSGSSIDPDKWQHEQDCWGGGNGELQCYTNRPENSRVEGGNLIITARQEQYTGKQTGCTSQNGCTDTKPYTSARLRTRHRETGSWKYGRFEMKAKLPKGKHLWPAFWMLPTDLVYGVWAGSGEVDIMEYRGQNPNSVQSTLFYGAPWPDQKSTTPGMKTFAFDFSADFHVFVFEWEEDVMRFKVDGTLVWTVDLNKSWGPAYSAPRKPWDQRFHILINLAVGGNFFNGLPGLTAAEAAAWTQNTYTIDYIRVYKKGDTPAAVCGDEVCNNGETTATCPLDCPPATTGVVTTGAKPATTGVAAFCGDDVCNNGETTATCPLDCPPTGSTTGVSYPATTGLSYPATTGLSYPATTGSILPPPGTTGKDDCASRSDSVAGQEEEAMTPKVQAMQQNLDNQMQVVLGIVIGGMAVGVVLLITGVVLLIIVLKRQKNETGHYF